MGGITPIGVACHEFGHILGLPDLYNTANGYPGIGDWDLMASGSWNNFQVTPSNLSSWCKIFLGWQTPTLLQPGNFSMLNASENNFSYKINTPHSQEYFLIENRQHIGFDSFLPGTGLAIWHINTDKTTQAHINQHDVNNDVNLKGVDLEEADGLTQLDLGSNRGDAGDLFPGSTCNHTFNDSSNPNSKTYNPVVNTNKPVTNISESNNPGQNHAIFFCYMNNNPVVGTSLLCSSGSPFQVSNLSSLFTVNWASSSNIHLNSPQGSNPSSFVAYGSGDGWIEASLGSSCGNFAFPRASLWVGTAQVQSISGPSSTNIYTYNYYYANANHTSGTSYIWSINPTGPYLDPTPGEVNSCLVIFYQNGFYQLLARASNACGITTPSMKSINVGSRSFSLYPNPASDYVNISLNDILIDTISNSEQVVTDLSSANSDTKNYTVRIYNNQGSLVFTTKRSGISFNIPLTDMFDGTYIVEVDDGIKNYRQPLIIKHN